MSGSNWASGGEGLAKAALIEMTIASTAFPAAWPLTGIAYGMQGDPGEMWDAGMNWFDQAEQLGQAVQAAQAIQQQVGSASWTGKDYEAYREKSDDFITKLTAATMLAGATGTAMSIAAIETFIAIMILFVISSILAMLAALYWAFIGFVVTAPAAAEVQAMATALIATSTTTLETMLSTTQAVDAGLAAGIGAMLIADVGTQLATGDFGVLGDLGQATVDGLGTITKGLFAAGYQELVGAAFKSPATAPLAGELGLTELLGGKTLFEGIVGD